MVPRVAIASLLGFLDGAEAPSRRGWSTYDGRNGKLLLASVLEESEHIIADDDTSLAAQNVLGTHDCGL